MAQRLMTFIAVYAFVSAETDTDQSVEPDLENI
jgi:hypothetical protein